MNRRCVKEYRRVLSSSQIRFFPVPIDIDIEYILKCNKIKKLTTDPKDIIKALKKSSLLSVSEDGTKIFRTVPVAPVTNADDSTIYVVSIRALYLWCLEILVRSYIRCIYYLGNSQCSSVDPLVTVHAINIVARVDEVKPIRYRIINVCL